MKDDEEERYYPYLYPKKEENKIEILSPEEDKDQVIEKIKKDISVNIAFEERYADEKEIMHEEFEERYNLESRLTVILNTVIIFILLMLSWFIVVIEFDGNILTWIICPIFTLSIVYQLFSPFTMKVPPNQAARKAVILASAAAILMALVYEIVKYLLRFI